jgi:hypothetical protein
MECPSRYETQSEPKKVGIGHTIDLASGGICFTTESLLLKDIEATVLVKWPVPLEDAQAVELRAVGKLVRTEAMKAALHIKTLSFRVERAVGESEVGWTKWTAHQKRDTKLRGRLH